MLKEFHNQITVKPLVKVYLVAIAGGFSGYWIAEILLSLLGHK